MFVQPHGKHRDRFGRVIRLQFVLQPRRHEAARVKSVIRHEPVPEFHKKPLEVDPDVFRHLTLPICRPSTDVRPS